MKDKLESEKVIIAAPFSYKGATQRILRNRTGITRFLLIIVVLPIVYYFITIWYIIFGILLVPFRLLRRSERKTKKQELQHREILEALQKKS